MSRWQAESQYKAMAENSRLKSRKNLSEVTVALLCKVMRDLFLKAFKQRPDGCCRCCSRKDSALGRAVI